MCSEYTIKTRDKSLHSIGIDNKTGEKVWDRRIKFGSKEVPIVEMRKDKPTLINSMWPPPPPLPNARLSGSDYDAENIRRIYQLPTWKKGFTEHPVLIPATEFYEPAYWGESKGSVLGFTVPKEELFFIAGIKFQAKGDKTDTFDRFAMVTHTPTEQMLEYHRRLVVILKPDVALGYLEAETPEGRFDFVLKSRYLGKLTAQEERKLAKGWEKRVDERVEDLKHEKAYMKILKREGVEG